MGPVPGATEAIALLLVYARPPLIGVPAAGADPHSHASVGSLPGVYVQCCSVQQRLAAPLDTSSL